MEEQSVFFRFHPSLQQVIQGSLRWKELRPVQEQAFLPIRSGMNTLLTARTAGGKSEAALFPILDKILTDHPDLPVCLYIAPLRALITDMAQRLDQMLAPLHLTCIQVHGDCPFTGIPDSDSPAVVLTTPESLLIMLQGNDGFLLKERIRVCIIDEVHSLAASERGAQLLVALQMMETTTGIPIQRIGLSATIANPEEVLAWMSRPGQPAQVIRADEDTHLREFIFLTGWDGSEPARLHALIAGKRSLIFAQSRSEAESLASLLERSRTPVYLHHSSLSTGIRRNAEAASFEQREMAVICTSTLELGIDIGFLDLVVQLGPGVSVSSFLQRLGRVGRRGERAQMAFVLRDDREVIRAAAMITAAVSRKVEPVIIQRFPHRAVVQQIVVSLLHEGRIGEWALVHRVETIDAFSRIPRERFMFIIAELVSREYLIRDGDFLMPGRILESWGSVRQGLLYSVIGGEQVCDIRSGDGEVIGTIPSQYAEGVRDRPFRLGGKSWKDTGTDPHPSHIRVSEIRTPADPPVFGGSFQGVSFLLAREMGVLIRDGLSDLPFPDLVRESLDCMVSVIQADAGPDSIVVKKDDDGIIVYTFLGEVWNRVLSEYLKELWKTRTGKKISARADDISFWLRGPDLNPDWIKKKISVFSVPDPGQSGDWMDRIPDSVRAYDELLPDFFLREMKIYDQLRLDDLVQELALRRITVI